VRFAADEAVKVLEAAAPGGPSIERAGRARLPHRHFMTFAELRGGVAVELQCSRDRRSGVGKHGTVTGRTAGDLRDAAHPDRVMIAARQQRLARRRTQRGGVKPVVLQAACRKAFGVRRLAWTPEGARSAEARIVDQHDQDVGRALGRAQLLDHRILRVGIFRVIGHESRASAIRNWQDASLNVAGGARRLLPIRPRLAGFRFGHGTLLVCFRYADAADNAARDVAPSRLRPAPAIGPRGLAPPTMASHHPK
jgi:hypothetical protein